MIHNFSVKSQHFHHIVFSDELAEIGAIDELSEELTQLGQKLALLPCHPRLGKMVLMACMFKCLVPILDTVAVLSDKDPFILSNIKTRVKNGEKISGIRKIYDNGVNSDHLMFHRLYQAWENAYDAGNSYQFCLNNCLNERVLSTMWKIKKDVYDRLISMDLVTDLEDANVNARNTNLVKGVISSAFHVAKCDRYPSKDFNFVLDSMRHERIWIDRRSVNQRKRMPEKYMTYFNIQVNRKGNVQIKDCTNVHEKLIDLFASHITGAKNPLSGDLQDCFEEFLSGEAKDNNNENGLKSGPPKTIINVLQFIKQNAK